MPQEDFRVNSLCDGKVILAGARMSQWMHNNPKEGSHPVAILITIDQWKNLEAIEVLQMTESYSLVRPAVLSRPMTIHEH
jgi:hypothetical protein